MRRFILAFVAIGAFVAHAGMVQAGSIGNVTKGVVNELEDRDYETAFNLGPVDPNDPNSPNFRIVPGSLFLGVIRIETFGSPPPFFDGDTYNPGDAQQTVTGVFAIRAVSINNFTDAVEGDRTSVYFEPIRGSWNTAFGLDYLPEPTNPNTMFIAYDDVTVGATDGGNANLETALTSFVGSNVVYEFGFEGNQSTVNDVTSTDAGEFWIAEGARGTDVVGFRLNTLTNVINLNALVTSGGAPPLAPHDYLSTQADLAQNPALRSGVSFANAADLQSRGTVDVFAPTVTGFPIRTNTQLYILPVPEPSSLIVFAGVAGLCAIGRRRRK